MRTSSKILSLAVVLATILVCIAAAAFAFTPYGSKSQLIWDEFRKQENLDTLCLGSSVSGRTFDPNAVDETCGSNSFNLSTPAQQIPESYLALKEALEHHKIKRVIYGVDFATFQKYTKLYPGRVFLNEKWKGDPFFQRFDDLSYALDDASWMFADKSINWLFPWAEQRVRRGFGNMFNNARMKLDGTSLSQAAEANEKGWTYVGKGYGNYRTVKDYNDSKQVIYGEKYKPKKLNETSMERFGELIELCKENDIDFIAMVPPLPDYSLISLEKVYAEDSAGIKEFVESNGGSYYDFNLAKPELFNSQDNYYADEQHCNFKGASATSQALGRLITLHEAGQDTSSLFQSYEERLASIDHISVVKFSSTSKPEGVTLKARVYAGTNVEPEYRFQVKNAESGKFVTVREYNTSPEFLFKPEKKGNYTIKVQARVVGSQAEYDRFTQHDITY